MVCACLSIAGVANGRGQKRDNTKQTTLFGLPAGPAPEKPEKRTARKKGGAVPCEGGGRLASPESRESQDVEMAEEFQGTGVPTSQTATAVDSQQESQATEVITTQVEGNSYLRAGT
jgi:chromosome transmission fidelity protein 4